MPFESDFRSFAKVDLTADDLARMKEFVLAVTKAKTQEEEHQRDGDRELERWAAGRLGEIGLERYLGVPFVDWTVGPSWSYDVADLGSIGIPVGVKTAKWGNYPVVPVEPRHKEIILVWQAMSIHICGLARQSTMLRYSDLGLIMNDNLRAKGTKAGFYGFDELLPFNGLDDLRRLANDGIY